MAIRLLGHFWRLAVATPGGETRQRAEDWRVEPREPSQWNPGSAASTVAATPRSEPRPADPVWPETQPWCHD